MKRFLHFKKRLPALLSVIFIFQSPLAGADKFSIGGYYKAQFNAYDFPDNKSTIDLPVDFIIWAASNSARLDLNYYPRERICFNLAYSITPRVSDPILPFLFDYSPLAARIDPQGYRVDDVKNRLYPDSWEDDQGIAFFQNLDRAVVTIRTSRADFFIGRQAIAWGSARIINPTDIITPFTYDELNTEDRVGVDAFRMRWPLGVMSEIDAGYIAGRNFKFDRSAAYLRTKWYACKTDITFITAGFRGNLMAGIDLARALGGAGMWLEGAYVWVDALNNERNHNDRDYFRATIGLDYSFGDRTYGFLEYHYNGAGAVATEDYLERLEQPAYTEGAVYLMSRHYLTPGITHQLTPLFLLSGQLLVNLTEPSGFLTPQFEYNIAPNIYINGGAFIGLGKYPVFEVDIDEITVKAQLRSEFGSYTNIFFSSLRMYF